MADDPDKQAQADLKAAQKVAQDTPPAGAVDPDEGVTPRDDDDNFVSKQKPVQGVQPVTEDDIPEAGR